MILVKILKRKDASSLIVAIVVAMIVGGLLAQVSIEPTSQLIGANDQYGPYDIGPEGNPGGPGWQITYLQPVVAALLQLVVLEVLAWIVIGINAALSPKKRK